MLDNDSFEYKDKIGLQPTPSLRIARYIDRNCEGKETGQRFILEQFFTSIYHEMVGKWFPVPFVDMNMFDPPKPSDKQIPARPVKELMPEYDYRESKRRERLKDIEESIQSYDDNGLRVPREWFEERELLIRENYL